MLKVCVLSDLHGRLPLVPECDVVVLAGDVAPDAKFHWHMTSTMRAEEQRTWFDVTYREWEASVVQAPIILAIPGNHDWCQTLPDGLRTQWLIDQGVTIDGRTFYGMPWVPRMYGRWTFEANREYRRDRCADIPVGLDLLITHAPPHRILDRTMDNESVGCEEIRAALGRTVPKHHVFGHIHEGRRDGHDMQYGLTTCYNVAMWGKDWMPRVLEL